jgi:hypothetical protein
MFYTKSEPSEPEPVPQLVTAPAPLYDLAPCGSDSATVTFIIDVCIVQYFTVETITRTLPFF